MDIGMQKNILFIGAIESTVFFNFSFYFFSYINGRLFSLKGLYLKGKKAF